MILVMYSNFPPSDRHRTVLARLADDLAVHAVQDEKDAVANAPDAEIILGHRFLRQALPNAPGLRWVQSTAAGVDLLQAPELLREDITLSRNPVHAPVVARHAIAMAWALLRRIPQAVLFQEKGRWASPSVMPPLPFPQKALVMGLGETGREICRLLKAHDIRVFGTARTGSAVQLASCDEFIPFDDWREALGLVDICFIALPLTRTTRGIMGAAELSKFRQHAVIVNVARAPIMDIYAAAEALREGRLGGVATDVLDPVPPHESPLWHTPHLLITPMLASYHPAMQTQTEMFIEGQVARYLKGEPLLHIVDKETLRDSIFAEDAE